MDYKKLLLKYIKYVKKAEGSDFILFHDERKFAGVNFSDQEWNELILIAQKIENS